jgi:hypothetical protein
MLWHSNHEILMHRLAILALLAVPAMLPAQEATPTPEQQIALAVLPLPKDLRADATVLGYNATHHLVPLRRGSGSMTCLADDPAEADNFHVACYHNSMEPFMARGRALRAAGVKDAQVDTVRFAEVKSGKLSVPKVPAALWQLNGPMSAVDVTAGTVGPEIRALYVVYIPFATPATTGISATPVPGQPWLMFPGTPKAHIMIIPPK